MTTEGDRLSNLSDDLIHKILSYIDTQNAIQTSILSSRWKNTWKSIPHLDLSSSYNVTSLPKFDESVNHVLSSRNNKIELVSVKLTFHGEVSHDILKTIMSYTISHNVQKMTICLRRWFIEFPFSLLVCQSLKDLTLTGGQYIMITSSWNLQALTTLYLDYVSFNSNENPDDHFSKCPNLKTLTLANLYIKGANDFTISHSQLSNLTIEHGFWNGVLNLVAPHLKDLTIVKFGGDLMISAPKLSSLTYESIHRYNVSTDGLSSLEKVDFYIRHLKVNAAPKIIDMLQLFHNVKYLTLGLEIVEVLASCGQLISHLPSPFANLTSFKIYPITSQLCPLFDNMIIFKICPSNLKSEEDGHEKIKMPTEVKNYLLNGSPSATVSIFSREEVQALYNAELAQKYMVELQMLLVQEKISCETNINTDRCNMNEQRETRIDDRKLVKDEISQINNCWKDLFNHIKNGKCKIDDIFSKLYKIEEILNYELPTSKKDNIEARFSSLCVEAYNVTKLIMDCMKIN